MDKNILRDYANFLEDLKFEDLALLDQHLSNDVQFRDPFNDCVGIDGFRDVLSDMFLHIASPKFRVKECMFCEKKRIGFLLWTLTGKSKVVNRKELSIEGVSRVTFDLTGKVNAHFDYWDTATGLYEKLPILGFLLKKIRKKISSTISH